MLGTESKEHEPPQPFIKPEDLDHLHLQGDPVTPEVALSSGYHPP
jgi:hypothetical protein